MRSKAMALVAVTMGLIGCSGGGMDAMDGAVDAAPGDDAAATDAPVDAADPDAGDRDAGDMDAGDRDAGGPADGGRMDGAAPDGGDAMPDGATDATVDAAPGDAGSSDATLSGLELPDCIGVSPSFAADHADYAIEVPYGRRALALTPTASHPGATITVDGMDVASGASSPDIELSGASPTIDIVVTAEDGTTRTYTVTVDRIHYAHAVYVDAGADAGSLYGELVYARRALAGGTWETQVLDDGLYDRSTYTYATQEVVIDDEGHPHVAYAHFDADELRYTRFDGCGWGAMGGSGDYDVLDMEVAITTNAKNFLTIHEGRPHLAFRQYTDLKYYWWDGTAWDDEVALELFPSSGFPNPGGAPAIAFDSTGSPHVAHHDHNEYHPHHSARSGTGWSNESIVTSDLTSGYKMIALDADDEPHIVFDSGYTHREDGSWVTSDGTSGYEAFEAHWVAATTTAGGDILLGEQEDGTLYLRRKGFDDTSWSARATMTTLPSIATAALAADRDGNAYAIVAEPSSSTYEIHFVEPDGGGWARQTVTSSSNRLVHPAVTID